jgi:hypothetical protein
MAVRFFVLPTVGVCVFLVLIGAAAIEHDARWNYVVRGTAGALVIGNLFYLVNNFYLPWHRHDLVIRSFFLGERSPRMGSWVYLPKDDLVQALQQLNPPPEQIVAPASLSRPLRAMLDEKVTGIRVTSLDEADKKLRSVLVDYRSGHLPRKRCLPTAEGEMCFSKPRKIGGFYVVYR